MTATLAEANDEILTLFKTAWDTTGHVADYANVERPVTVPPTTTAPWARARVQHTFGEQDTLAGPTGTQRFRRDGLFTCQIFVPSGEGLSEAYSLAKTVMDAFEGASTDSGVWFRNARVNEVGPDGEWYQLNVLVDFTYTEVK